MPLSYRELSSPIVEPVSLQMAKQQCKVDFDADDTLISAYIVASRQFCEKQTGRNFYNRKMVLTLDYFPWPGWQTVTGSSHDSYLGWYFRSLSIRLPKPATFSIDQVSYLNEKQETIIIDPSQYVTDLVSEPARIFPAPGFTWPYQNQYIPGQVRIEFTSGTYGDGKTIDNCPMTIKLAMLLLVSHFYNNRESSTETSLKTIPLGVAELLAGESFETVC